VAVLEVAAMKRGIQVLFLILLGIVLSACAASGPPAALSLGQIQWPPSEYKHTVGTGAIRQYWNCTRLSAEMMRLDGVAANQWSDQPVRFLEWELVGVNADGRDISSAKVESKAIKLMTNQYTKYQVDLQTTGGEARFDLYYQYQFFDRSHIEASLDWDGPVLFAQQNQRFFVLDACSDTQHLVR
jgi:hypothetical protein